MAYISPKDEDILFNIDLIQYTQVGQPRALKVTRRGTGTNRLRIVTHDKSGVKGLIRLTQQEAFHLGMTLVTESKVDDSPYRGEEEHLADLDEIDAALED